MCPFACPSKLALLSYVSDLTVIHYQLRQADITNHLFPDHVDFVPYLALGMNIILSLSVQFSSHSETSITPFSIPEPLCPEGSHDCLQVYFRLFRHDKRLVLMFLTRLLTTLAHLYNLVGWLKMANPPPPLASSLLCSNITPTWTSPAMPDNI